MKERHIFFRAGTKAVNVGQISHWWIAEGPSNGLALCIVMANGQRILIDKEDTKGIHDGFALEAALTDFIRRGGRP